MRESLQKHLDSIDLWLLRNARLVRLVRIGVTALIVGLALTALPVTIFDNEDRVNEIQASRVEGSRESCLEENTRYGEAIAGLERLVARNPPKRPLGKLEARRQKRALAEFAGVIAPHYDCSARVKRLTHGRK